MPEHVPTERIVDEFEANGELFITTECSCGVGVNAMPRMIAEAFQQHVERHQPQP